MKRTPTLKQRFERLSGEIEELRSARTALVEVQHMMQSASIDMRDARQALLCSAELHSINGNVHHADLAFGAAARLSAEIERFEKVARLSVDAAIADLTIPF